MAGNPNIKDHAAKGGKAKKENQAIRQARVVDEILSVAGYLNGFDSSSLQGCAIEDPKWFWEKMFKATLPKQIDLGSDPDRPVLGKMTITYVKPGDTTT